MGLPLSAEEQARLAAFYGANPNNSSPADAPPASQAAPQDVASFYGPATAPPPLVDSGPLYNYGTPADSDPAPPPAPAPPPQFSWNAPGYENVHTAPFSGPATIPQAPLPAGIFTSARGAPTEDRGGQVSPEDSGSKAAASAALEGFSKRLGGTSDEKPKATAAASHGAAAAYYGKDPFGIDAARKGIRGSYDKEAAGLQAGTDAEKARADMLAAGGMDMAQQKAQAAADAQAEAQLAADHFRSYQEETQRQLDDVKSQKIDPNRLYADGGSKAMAIFGALVGGMYQGRNKLASNPFLDEMNKNIDRDIAVQEKNLANARANVSERRSLLGDMRATYHDETLAKAQAKNLYWESAKEQLAAQAATFDSPVAQARADMGIAAINREQSKLDLDGAMKKAAQAQAAAAAQAAAQERARKNALEERKMRVEEGHLGVEAAEADAKGEGKHADLASRFVSTGQDKDGNPTGYLERNAEGAKERETSHASAQALMSKADDALAIRKDAGGMLGRTLNRQNPDQAIQLYTPEWQTKIRGLKAEMITDWGHAKKLGVLSDSDRKLAEDAIGDLESKGERGDVALTQLKAILQKALDAEDKAAGGARATKIVDPETGRERIVLHGNYNAPNNPKGSTGFAQYDPKTQQPVK